jgi:hypothetical protein
MTSMTSTGMTTAAAMVTANLRIMNCSAKCRYWPILLKKQVFGWGYAVGWLFKALDCGRR